MKNIYILLLAIMIFSCKLDNYLKKDPFSDTSYQLINTSNNYELGTLKIDKENSISFKDPNPSIPFMAGSHKINESGELNGIILETTIDLGNNSTSEYKIEFKGFLNPKYPTLIKLIANNQEIATLNAIKI